MWDHSAFIQAFFYVKDTSWLICFCPWVFSMSLRHSLILSPWQLWGLCPLQSFLMELRNFWAFSPTWIFKALHMDFGTLPVIQEFFSNTLETFCLSWESSRDVWDSLTWIWGSSFGLENLTDLHVTHLHYLENVPDLFEMYHWVIKTLCLFWKVLKKFEALPVMFETLLVVLGNSLTHTIYLKLSLKYWDPSKGTWVCFLIETLIYIFPALSDDSETFQSYLRRFLMQIRLFLGVCNTSWYSCFSSSLSGDSSRHVHTLDCIR